MIGLSIGFVLLFVYLSQYVFDAEYAVVLSIMMAVEVWFQLLFSNDLPTPI